jgi:hypothetical protein
VLVIVVAAWLVLAVVGGWLIGRGLGAIERHGADNAADPGHDQPPDLRQAA